MKKLTLSLSMLLAMLFLLPSCGDDDDDVTPDPDPTDTTTVVIPTTQDVPAEITTNTTLTADRVWIMTSKVWVSNGATLTIEPGTIVKADSKTDPAQAVALIVTAGSKLNAIGTASAPIIFTSSDDAIALGGTSSLTSSTAGKWGGIVLIGKATADTKDEVNGVLIEGVSSSETRGIYGTTTLDTDNSGTIKYVSIRHGGASVSADSELNGLSLYGVGSGTTIDYVEVFANDDDGIEFFGGTVKVTHALVSHCSDDSFDWDQGYTGHGQYWATIQTTGSDKGFESDGGEGDLNPNSIPTIANFTLIGQGTSTAIDLKKKTGGNLYNGLIMNFAKGIQNNGAADADLSINGINVSGATGFAVFEEGTNNDLTAAAYITALTTITTSSLSYNTTNNGSADVIPSTADAATSTSNPASLSATTYKGAFDPTATSTWAANWTRSWELGLID